MSAYLFYIIFDIFMAAVMFLMGLYFYKSNGKAANLLTGYNMRPDRERVQYNEKEMCQAYGKRMMLMAVPFVIGAVIDLFTSGKGCLLGWICWIVMFVLLLKERYNREK